mmetsp:Transcript_4650/g.5388  ORF Transcript_4650/g.5388 Transcript_4650/m.5388 type:complete len:152 (-) Transcript_4650:916-1371(-)
MRHLERWKRYCLGDGGVYFDQRPKTLTALNCLLCQEMVRAFGISASLDGETNENDDVDVDVDAECAIISTCARLGIIVSVELPLPSVPTSYKNSTLPSTTTATTITTTTPTATTALTNEEIETLVKTTTAQFLSEQVVSYRRDTRLSFSSH